MSVHSSAGLTCVAFRPRPAFQTRFVSISVTRVMPKELVPGPTELVATKAEVMVIAANPDLVLELSDGAVVGAPLPVVAGVDHARKRRFLYQLPFCT